MTTEEQLEALCLDAIKTVIDPEMEPVNIYDLGLIYEIKVDPSGVAKVVMTLTTPNCPVAEAMPTEVVEKVSAIDGITDVDLHLTFDPPWKQEMMTDEAKFALGLL